MKKEDFEKAKDLQNRMESLEKRIIHLEEGKKSKEKNVVLKFTHKQNKGINQIYITSLSDEEINILINREIKATQQELSNLNFLFDTL